MRILFRPALTAGSLITLLLLILPQPIKAATPDTQVQVEQAKITQIDQQLQSIQSRLDILNGQLNSTQQQEDEQRQRLAALARSEYQQPFFSLDHLLAAQNLGQLLSDLAQARLVALKQSDLLKQLSQLHQQEQKTQSQLNDQLNEVKASREAAAKVVGDMLSQGDPINQGLLGQATSLACNNSSTPQSCPAGSIQQIITGAFTPQGGGAVNWGIRIAKCESGFNPKAVNPSGASGLFQFMPSTFANTPSGKAGGSIWDPVAQSQAAAWMYSQGRQKEWSCNSIA